MRMPWSNYMYQENHLPDKIQWQKLTPTDIKTSTSYENSTLNTFLPVDTQNV